MNGGSYETMPEMCHPRLRQPDAMFKMWQRFDKCLTVRRGSQFSERGPVLGHAGHSAVRIRAYSVLPCSRSGYNIASKVYRSVRKPTGNAGATKSVARNSPRRRSGASRHRVHVLASDGSKGLRYVGRHINSARPRSPRTHAHILRCRPTGKSSVCPHERTTRDPSGGQFRHARSANVRMELGLRTRT